MGKNVDSVAYECSNKRVRGKGVALEYYFRAIDEFTILIPQLDETFSFFFFFGKAFFDAIIPFLFFGEIFDGWRYSTLGNVSKDGMQIAQNSNLMTYQGKSN